MPGGFASDGVYRYSFDFKKYENEELGAIVRFVGYDHGNSATGFDANKIFESIYLDTAFRYYNNLNGIKQSDWRTWKMSDYIAEIEQGVWNHIEFYLDMYARYVYYYYNNKLLGKDKICPDLKQLWGVDFTVEKGNWVLSDRFADSTVAYQYYGYDKKVPYETLESLYKIAVGGFKPDLTLIFDLDPKIGLARSFKKAEGMVVKETRHESRGLAFHERMRRGFLEIAAKESERCIVVDADKSIEALHREVVKIVTERFGLG